MVSVGVFVIAALEAAYGVWWVPLHGHWLTLEKVYRWHQQACNEMSIGPEDTDLA